MYFLLSMDSKNLGHNKSRSKLARLELLAKLKAHRFSKHALELMKGS